MKKILTVLLVVLCVAACSKHDPILPGDRIDIFDSADIEVKNQELPDLSDKAVDIYGDEICEYHQDASNVIWES